jgi:hypothetical protein
LSYEGLGEYVIAKRAFDGMEEAKKKTSYRNPANSISGVGERAIRGLGLDSIVDAMAPYEAPAKHLGVDEKMGWFYPTGLMKALEQGARNVKDQFSDPEGYMGFMPFGGVTAWHGSPHKFSKFRMDKMGTGQGAQEIAHGLYFAENKGTAHTYRQLIDKPMSTHPGELYKVDIPDEAIGRMLNWENTISEQPEGIRKAINTLMDNLGHVTGDVDGLRKSLSAADDGKQFYKILSEAIGGQEKASKVLNDFGIPGVKYMDDASEMSNFVVFDENLPKIIE